MCVIKKNTEVKMHINELTQLFLEKIKTQYSQPEWEFYLSNLKFADITDDTIKLTVDTEFVYAHIKKNLFKKITTDINNFFDKTLKIEFSLDLKINNDEDYDYTPPVPQEDYETDEYSKTKLSPQYKFENFVIGENCDFAANVAIAISKDPGSQYNPLLLYGGVGLGKTHLLHAIGNACYENDKTKKIIYISAEDFTNEFISSIKTNTFNENSEYSSSPFNFKKKFRTADILLIDDIHFFENKTATQEELFFIFNILYDNQKQMVFTCDRPIEKLKDMTDRIKTRIGRGINIDLQPPGLETRIAILQSKIPKLKEYNTKMKIDDKAITYIAEQTETNIRDLESNFKTSFAYASVKNNSHLTLDIAKYIVKEKKNQKKNNIITFEKICLEVSKYFGTSESEILSKKRTSVVVKSRHWVHYLSSTIADLSFSEIGKKTSRDHSTVMHSVGIINKEIETDAYSQQIKEELIEKIKKEY